MTITAENGSPKRVYFYGITKREARAKAEPASDRLAAGSLVRESSRSLADWPEEWRATVLRASDRALSTKELYRAAVQVVVVDAAGVASPRFERTRLVNCSLQELNGGSTMQMPRGDQAKAEQ